MNLSRFVLFNFVTFSFAGFLSSQAWGEDAVQSKPSGALEKITSIRAMGSEFVEDKCNGFPYFNSVTEYNKTYQPNITEGAYPQIEAAEKSYSEAQRLMAEVKTETDKANATVSNKMDTVQIETSSRNTQAKTSYAKSKFKSCAAEARAAKENVLKYEASINQIVSRFAACEQTGTNPACDQSVPVEPYEQYEIEMKKLNAGYIKCRNYVNYITNSFTKPLVQTDLNDLITKCEKDAGASELTTGQAALLGVAAGAIAGGVIIKTREDRQKKKNREGNGIPGVASGPNSGNSGNNNNGGNSGNGAGDPPVGSTDGCPAGQARNLNNVCVPTTPNNSTGVGGTPEPGQPQSSTGSVPINPPPPANGGISNSGGGTPAIGRGLTVRPQTDTTGTTSALSSASNSATPTTNTDAAQNGPVTQQTNESKFWIKIKGENEFVTMKRCISLTKDKNKCEVAKRNHSRNLTNKIKIKNQNLLE